LARDLRWHLEKGGSQMATHAQPIPLAGTDREAVRRALASSPELRHLVAVAGSYAKAAFGQDLPDEDAHDTLAARQAEFLSMLHRVETAQFG
jgi:hypothetical protein